MGGVEPTEALARFKRASLTAPNSARGYLCFIRQMGGGCMDRGSRNRRQRKRGRTAAKKKGKKGPDLAYHDRTPTIVAKGCGQRRRSCDSGKAAAIDSGRSGGVRARPLDRRERHSLQNSHCAVPPVSCVVLPAILPQARRHGRAGETGIRGDGDTWYGYPCPGYSNTSDDPPTKFFDSARRGAKSQHAGSPSLRRRRRAGAARQPSSIRSARPARRRSQCPGE